MTDLLTALPRELALLVLGYIDARTLFRMERVSKGWRALVADPSRWHELTDELWKDKVYVPLTYKADYAAGMFRKAYVESIADSKRQTITLDEMCEFKWSFRFKAAAGENFVSTDSWWQGPRNGRVSEYRRYHRDGTLSSTFMTARWRFVSTTMGLVFPMGRVVKVNFFPPYLVFRDERNWGFILESCWTVHTSFPMPARGEDAYLEDENLHVQANDQAFECFLYNSSIPYEDNLVLTNDSFKLLVERHNAQRMQESEWENTPLMDAEDDDDMAEDEFDPAEYESVLFNTDASNDDNDVM